LPCLNNMSKCGIGLAVRLLANGMFQVEDMTPNTPSQLCGFFKKGDLITAVDSNSVIGFTMDQFVDAVLGAPGSDITVVPALNSF
jgi:C-terminal processing protease CtpA/Prc